MRRDSPAGIHEAWPGPSLFCVRRSIEQRRPRAFASGSVFRDAKLGAESLGRRFLRFNAAAAIDGRRDMGSANRASRAGSVCRCLTKPAGGGVLRAWIWKTGESVANDYSACDGGVHRRPLRRRLCSASRLRPAIVALRFGAVAGLASVRRPRRLCRSLGAACRAARRGFPFTQPLNAGGAAKPGLPRPGTRDPREVKRRRTCA